MIHCTSDEISEFRLVHGPSFAQLRECMFFSGSRPVVFCEFWGLHKHSRSHSSGMSLRIRIEKVVEVSQSHFLLWGSRIEIVWQNFIPRYRHLDFCFGRWSNFCGRGTLKCGETSFLPKPLSREEMDAIDARHM